jgi:hypothetical protein
MRAEQHALARAGRAGDGDLGIVGVEAVSAAATEEVVVAVANEASGPLTAVLVSWPFQCAKSSCQPLTVGGD